MVKKLLMVILIIIVTSGSASFSDNNGIVVSLGDDLSDEQRQQMLQLFGVDNNVQAVDVTNKEERRYLGKYISDDIIGTRAISSAYVELLEEGSGIDVEIYNITYVTKEMYMNALATAGVNDARVKIAAPVNVSGTAALTGVIKAFEGAAEVEIDESQKEVANEEIAKTGELGQEIGQENASQLIKEIKEEIIDKNLKDENEIREIIVRISGDLNINLNNNQIDELVVLMKNISNLNLDINQINQQLKGISDRINEIADNNEEVKSLLQRIIDLIREVFNSILSWIGEGI